MTTPPSLGDRYAPLRQLGAGGEGMVWLARDQLAGGREVAVKQIPARYAKAASLEFGLLHRLRHPGVAAVLGLERAPGGDLLLVCEVADGIPLGAWVGGRPRAAVVAALAELLAILDFLHRRGVIHRDLKDENVLCGPAGVKLVDFGLASEGVPREVSGTRGSLAPEVLEGRPASPQSDLYAFGMLCARVLWGRFPFEAGELVAAQLAGELRLPAPAEGDPLAPLCRRLLARDPALRPESAAEALESLARIAGTAVGEVRLALAKRGLPTPALQGRDALLARGRQALSRARDGDGPRILLVVGRRGEGRSRICDELGASAAQLGLRVRRGLVGSPLTAAPAGPAAPDPQAEAALALSGALDELRAQASEPLCLVLDDPSPIALRVARALASEPGLRFAAVVAVLAGSEAELALEHRAEVLRLTPFALSETDALCASILPESFLAPELAGVIQARAGGNPALACELLRSAVASWLASKDRSPASLVELATGEGGVAIEELVATRVRALDVPGRRIAAAVALFEAGTTESILIELLDARSLGWTKIRDSLEPPSIRRELSRLLDAGILAISAQGNLLEVAGGALGRVLLAELEAEERARLATRALALLEAREAPARDRAKVALVASLPGSGSILLAGAADARRALDLGEAARLYRAAIPLCELGPERRRARIAFAETALALGRTELALEALREAILEELDPAERRALRAALADAEIKAGRAADALRSLERAALEEPGSGLAAPTAKALLFAGEVEHAARVAEGAAEDPAATTRERAEALHLLGLARYTAGELDRARAPLEQALATPAAEDDPLEQLAVARIANTLAMLHQRRGELELARARYLECLRIAQALRHLPYQATLLQNLASVAELEGNHALALDRYQESLAVARRFGGLRETAQVLHNLARLRGHLGQHPEALELVRRSFELARAAPWVALEAQNLLLEAELQLDSGVELESAASLLDRAGSCFESAGDAAGRAEVELGRARLEILRDDPERAIAIASRLLEGAAGNHYVTLHAHLLRGRAELERGEHAAALRHLREARRLAEESGERDPLPEIHASLARVHDALGEAASAKAQQGICRALHEDQITRLPAELRGTFVAHPVRARLLASLPTLALEGAGIPERAARLDVGLLAALIAINRELNAEPELDRLLERIIDHAVELVGAERGFLLLSRGGSLRAEVARNIDQETIRRGELKISRSLAEEVLATGRPMVTIDAMDDDRFRSSLSVHDLRLRSVLCVPISVRRQVRGVIYLDDRVRREAFRREHRQLIEALAEQAGLAVGIWELLEENRLRRAELEEKGVELEQANRELRRTMAEQSEQLDELSSLARAQQGELAGRYHYQDLVGRGPAMRELFRLIDRAKDSLAPVLVQGESGTGKELVAKAIHYSGPRRAGPFISVNCGALPPNLLESELFGFERGAFTGAERQHRGLFERAHGGTLFLDELGEMPPELQVRLLRVLQEKRFARVGGEAELDSDFRLISASNRDLARMLREGSFREDLYYRVAVIELRLPALRERREEIPLLVEHLLARHGGGRPVRVSRQALRQLLEHDWPGNVRELENQILRALALGGPTLGPEDFSLRAGPSAREAEPPRRPSTLREAGQALERELVGSALERAHGNVTEAARELGITRVGLHKLLKRLGVEKRKVT